jgi:hypothetical protein
MQCSPPSGRPVINGAEWPERRPLLTDSPIPQIACPLILDGDEPPVDAEPGRIWHDSATGALYRRYRSPNGNIAWVQMGVGVGQSSLEIGTVLQELAAQIANINTTRSSGKKGGKKGGATRLERMKAWHAYVDEHAPRILKENPYLTEREEVARCLKDEVRAGKPWMPTVGTVARYVCVSWEGGRCRPTKR